MAAVQGLYVEIDFKFKNEAFMKGINDVKKLLKTLGTDALDMQKKIQQSGYRSGQVFQKISKDVSQTAKVIKKSADDMNKSYSKGTKDASQVALNTAIKRSKALQAMDKALNAQKNAQHNDAVKRAKALNAEFERLRKARIDKPLDDFNKKAQQSVKHTSKLQSGLNNIARGAMYRVGSMITEQFREGFQGVADIDFNIRGAVAKTGSMDQGYKSMMDLANEIGGKTKFNNLDAAIAINSAATLGLIDDQIKALMPSTANLAQAFNSDLNKTLEATISYLKTYGMEMSEATKVNDMVAVTSKRTAADIDRLQAGFQYVGSTANQMHIPIEKVFAILGKLNDVGIQGSSAGTSFNNFLVQLSKNYEDVEKLIGQKITGKNGQLKSIEDIFDMVGAKFKTLNTDAEKTKLSMDLFGIRGSKTFFTFLEQGTGDLRELMKEIDYQRSKGTANMMSAFMMKGIGGAIEEFSSTWETAFQSVFQAIEPLMMPIFIGLTMIGDIIIQLNKNFPQLAQAIATIAGLVIGKAVFKLMAKQIGMVKAAFSGAMTLKMLALAAALFIIYQGIRRFKEALDKDKEAAAQWQKVIENAKGVLKELANVILDVIKAMFGFGEEKNKLIGDGPNKNPSSDLALFLNDVREALRKTQEKLEKFRKWVNDNKEDFKKWGETIKEWGPIMAGLAVTAWLLANPLMMITLGVTMLPVATEEIKNAAKDIKKYSEEAGEATKGSMFKENSADIRKQAFEELEKKSRDRIKEIPILGSIYGFFEPILDFINSIPEAVINVFNDVGATIVDYGFEIGKALNYAMFGGLASDLGTKVGEKIRSINWSGIWDSVVNIAKSKWDSFVQWVFGKISELKERFPLLAQGLNAFHNALEVAKGLLRDIMNFSGKVITITLNFIKKGEVKNIVNDVVNESKNGLDFGNNLLKPKGTYVGTNHFSGGITAINEKGDELIMGPSGMIVANNPSTMNIMSKLSNLESQTSQMRFRMNDNQGSTNYITVHVGSVRSDDDIAEIKRTLENLALS